MKKSTSISSLPASSLNLAIEPPKPPIPDGGWGWVVVFATFTLYVIAEGVSFVFGLFYVEFLNEFNASKSATSWIGSLFAALPLIAGPVCSALVDKYGCRKMTIIGSVLCSLGFVLSSYASSIGLLYLTFGVIGGLSRGLVYITVVVSVAFWFEKKRAVALGISAAGTGVGTVLFAPLTTFLIQEYGWRGAVLILAGLLANMCVCGALMIDPEWVKVEDKQIKMKKLQQKAEKHSREMKQLLKTDGGDFASNGGDNEAVNNVLPTDSEKKWYTPFLKMFKFLSSFSLFLELHFLLLTTGTLLAGTWFLVPYFYLVDHMISTGYTEAEASFTLSAIGFTNTFGMVIIGWVGSRVNTAKIYGVCLILCGASIFSIMFFSSSYIMIVVSCGSFGFFFASTFVLAPALLGQLVTLDDFTMGYGLILLCEGSGHLIGPPIAGLITDLTHSWTQSFYQAGFWVLMAGVLIGIIPFTKNRRLIGSNKLSIEADKVQEQPAV